MLSSPINVEPITVDALAPLLAACFARRRQESIRPPRAIRSVRITAGSSLRSTPDSSPRSSSKPGSTDAMLALCKCPFNRRIADPSARSSSRVEGHLSDYDSPLPTHRWIQAETWSQNSFSVRRRRLIKHAEGQQRAQGVRCGRNAARVARRPPRRRCTVAPGEGDPAPSALLCAGRHPDRRGSPGCAHNPQSGKCLDDPNSSTTPGTQVQSGLQQQRRPTAEAPLTHGQVRRVHPSGIRRTWPWVGQPRSWLIASSRASGAPSS